MATGYPSAPSGRQPGQDRPKIDEDDLERLDIDQIDARARLSGLDSPEGLQAIARLLLDAPEPNRRPTAATSPDPRPSTAPPARPGRPRSGDRSRSSTR